MLDRNVVHAHVTLQLEVCLPHESEALLDSGLSVCDGAQAAADIVCAKLLAMLAADGGKLVLLTEPRVLGASLHFQEVRNG